MSRAGIERDPIVQAKKTRHPKVKALWVTHPSLKQMELNPSVSGLAPAGCPFCRRESSEPHIGWTLGTSPHW